MARYQEFNVNAQDQTITRDLVRAVETRYFVYGLSPSELEWKNLNNKVNYDSLNDVALTIFIYAKDPYDLIVKSISLGAGRVDREDALTIRANRGFNGISRRILTKEEGIDLARKIEEAGIE